MELVYLCTCVRLSVWIFIYIVYVCIYRFYLSVAGLLDLILSNIVALICFVILCCAELINIFSNEQLTYSVHLNDICLHFPDVGNSMKSLQCIVVLISHTAMIIYGVVRSCFRCKPSFKFLHNIKLQAVQFAILDKIPENIKIYGIYIASFIICHSPLL